MKPNVMLTIASPLSILFMTFHLTDDILHLHGGASNLVVVPILVVWLYGTLQLAKSSGFFLVWTLLALGLTGIFSLILSVHGLLSLQRGQPR